MILNKITSLFLLAALMTGVTAFPVHATTNSTQSQSQTSGSFDEWEWDDWSWDDDFQTQEQGFDENGDPYQTQSQDSGDDSQSQSQGLGDDIPSQTQTQQSDDTTQSQTQNTGQSQTQNTNDQTQSQSQDSSDQQQEQQQEQTGSNSQQQQQQQQQNQNQNQNTNNNPDPLSGSCYAHTNNPEEGDTVVWKTTASGGTGSYDYSWSGTNSLSGNNSQTSKVYSSAGTKYATVDITSGEQSITKNCSVYVEEKEQEPDQLTGSCFAHTNNPEEGDSVVWKTTASGGTGSYDYNWSGTDGLSGSGSQKAKTYNTPGTKHATVIISSGNQDITKHCSVYVEAEEQEPDQLTGSCNASPSTVEEGQTVKWQVQASGGTGNFSYSWSGTNGLSGQTSSVYKSYGSHGTKQASVTITSGNQSITRGCSVYVEEEEYNDPDYNDLQITCSPDGEKYKEGERVTWRAYVSGGDGDYDYDWSGTDGLNGNERTESIRYYDEGTKYADVRVRSGDGQVETERCRIYVEEERDYNDNDRLQISCEVSDTRIEEGDRVTFNVDIDGGDAPYDIRWYGDIDDIDDFDDDRRRQTVRIDDEGRYFISVEVEDDDGNRDTDQCRTIRVDEEDDDDDEPRVFVSSSRSSGGVGQVAGVALSQIPYTGLTDSPVLNAILYTLFGITLLVIGLVTLFILRKRDIVPVLSGAGEASENRASRAGYTDEEVVNAIEDTAHKFRVIVSTEAMDTLLHRSKKNKVKALMLLNRSIVHAKKGIDTEAWVVISKQKVTEIL